MRSSEHVARQGCGATEKKFLGVLFVYMGRERERVYIYMYIGHSILPY